MAWVFGASDHPFALADAAATRQPPTVQQRPWPVRFEAAIRLGGGGEATYNVLTWLGEPKAIALAVEHHLHSGDAGRIYDMSLRELGPAPRTSSGLVDIGHDIHERMEF